MNLAADNHLDVGTISGKISQQTYNFPRRMDVQSSWTNAPSQALTCVNHAFRRTMLPSRAYSCHIHAFGGREFNLGNDICAWLTFHIMKLRLRHTHEYYFQRRLCNTAMHNLFISHNLAKRQIAWRKATNILISDSGKDLLKISKRVLNRNSVHQG